MDLFEYNKNTACSCRSVNIVNVSFDCSLNNLRSARIWRCYKESFTYQNN